MLLFYFLKVEEYRNKRGDRVGLTRYLHELDKNRTQDLAYGMPSGLLGTGGKPRETAKDIMNGNYMESHLNHSTANPVPLMQEIRLIR